MSVLKSLVKDTAIYGLSSMLGRFLNWLLVAVYTRVLLPVEMGQMTQLYALTAILLVILTYGMETSFFRFVNKHARPREVYGTSLILLATTSLTFVIVGLSCLDAITAFFAFDVGGISKSSSELLVATLILISALDAFCAIPLGYLRYAGRPFRFMAVRMGFVLFTVFSTLIAFYLLPWLFDVDVHSHALTIILAINLLGCVVQLLMLLPTFKFADWYFDKSLAREMLGYAAPILLLGIVGVFSGQADKLIFPLLYDNPLEGKLQLGIYSACYKIAVIMVLFTQAFRYAYDPFVFAKAKEGGEQAKEAYSLSMRYYVLFTLFIFLGVMSTLDILKYYIDAKYHSGLPVVPLVMLGQLMFGIYFNLSVWYKLTDRTYWGAILSILGCIISILWIVLGTPTMGFMACAWASIGSNAIILIVSYLLGQRYYPIQYPWIAIATYSALALGIWGIQSLFANHVSQDDYLRLGFNLVALGAFVGIVTISERLHLLAKPFIRKLLKR